MKKLVLIKLSTLRIYKVRKELLNSWYEATTIRKSNGKTVCVRERIPWRIWEDEQGLLYVLYDSPEGVAVATHDNCY